MSDRLQARLATLAELAGIAQGRVPPEVAARIEATNLRAAGRMAHGSTWTVAALAGATGSGKSSTFNAVTGRDIAATGVRRPTTSATQAVVFAASGELDADVTDLLDWLEVPRRTVVAARDLDGLVLLDLPDHDSTAVAHRQEVDRLVRVVDVFAWVVDPQKYADAALHRDYLRRFAGHADVTMVVLNHIDTLSDQDRKATLDDIAKLLRDDGLDVASVGMLATLTGRTSGVRVFGASARTGEGIGELRRELAARAAERKAAVSRLEADLDWIAGDVASAIGGRPPGSVDAGAERALGDSLASAVGIEAIADAVAASHRQRGRLAAGWPPTRWVGRLRPDPLRRLGLARRAPASAASRAQPTPRPALVDRTMLAPSSPVAAAAVSGALRSVADRAGSGLPAEWQRRITDAANSRRADLDDAVDRAVATAELPGDRPGWWAALGVLQWTLTAAMGVGLAWLLLLGIAGWFRLPDVPTPALGPVPWPTLLAVGGGGGGLLVAATARWINGAGARRRASMARRSIARATARVAAELVIAPITSELESLARVHALTQRLRR